MERVAYGHHERGCKVCGVGTRGGVRERGQDSLRPPRRTARSDGVSVCLSLLPPTCYLNSSVCLFVCSRDPSRSSCRPSTTSTTHNPVSQTNYIFLLIVCSVFEIMIRICQKLCSDLTDEPLCMALRQLSYSQYAF